jgi:arabinose-5-phosphate isomerase
MRCPILNQTCPLNARSSFEPERALQLARDAVTVEAQALLALRDRLGEAFVQAVQAMLDSSHRVVVMGMGKSGHVGRKIAATLASTGTPAFFVHPARPRTATWAW